MSDGEADGPRDATRPAAPVPWPAGRRAAAALTFDVDAESAVLSAHPRARNRLAVMSHQAYGPLTGVPRILRLLERRGLRATFFVPGYTAERHPSMLEAVLAGGHEVGHHGYLHEAGAGSGRDAQARALDRGFEALERVAGVRPVGYRAPLWEPGYDTVSLLLDRGFLYDSSLMDSDVPYALAEDGTDAPRSIVEIPVHWALDDWEQYGYVPGVTGSGLIESPAKVYEMWSLELEALHAEGGCFVLTNHPFLSGRPSRVAALERLVDRMLELGGLWTATLEEIARHVATLGLVPRHFPMPDLEE